MKKAHGHGLRGISRGTSAAELPFCSVRNTQSVMIGFLFPNASAVVKEKEF